MSAGIPYKFKIDFSGYGRDMVAKAWSRMLSQFWASPVMKDFVAALIKNGPEWAYREIVKQQEANTLYMAEGENLDAIGRIVGQPRVPYQYDDSMWFTPDRPGQGFDQAPFWVQNAPMAGNEPATDPEYRQMILARIVCNFNRFSSLPEMAYEVEFATGRKVSWRRVGPMECEIIVQGNISRSHLDVLTRKKTTTECDDIYWVPYPATLNLTRVLFLPVRKPFIFDRRDGHQFDAGYCAVSRNNE
jgi:hypothetical protein